MQSPPAEWALGIGYLAVLDLIRAHGEADNDTLSECVRDLIGRHRYGRPAFALSLGAGSLVLFRHICR